MPYFYVRTPPEVSLEKDLGNKQSGPRPVIGLLVQASLFVHTNARSKVSQIDLFFFSPLRKKRMLRSTNQLEIKIRHHVDHAFLMRDNAVASRSEHLGKIVACLTVETKGMQADVL